MAHPVRRLQTLVPLALLVAATACTTLPTARPGSVPFNGGVLNPPLQLPELTLGRSDGGTFTTAETRGRISLFFFGYTYCPDVCPLTLAYMTQVRRELGASAHALDIYFITVDPERDTPERLAQYLGNFDPAIVALRGEAEQLEAALNAFGAVAERRENPDGSDRYFMDHTAAVYLVDASGSIRLLFPHGMTPDQIAADVRRFIPR